MIRRYQPRRRPAEPPQVLVFARDAAHYERTAVEFEDDPDDRAYYIERAQFERQQQAIHQDRHDRRQGRTK